MVNTLEYRIEKKISSKGNEYVVLIIKLTPTYEKQVFLDNAEIELLKLQKINK